MIASTGASRGKIRNASSSIHKDPWLFDLVKLPLGDPRRKFRTLKGDLIMRARDHKRRTLGSQGLLSYDLH